MSLIERVLAILLRPKQTWPVIAAEPTDVATIYRRYLVILAAIPAIASFIGWTLVGGGMMGVSFRLPIVTGLIQVLVNFVLALVFTYVMALIVNALAPTFGGSKDLVAAFKLVAYGSTAAFVGGIFNLLPPLAWIGLIAAFYSLYLFYTGLPVLMRCPPAKAGAYTAVVIVCTIVLGIAVAALSSLVVGPGPMGFGSHTAGGPMLPGRAGGDLQIKTPDGTTVTINPSAIAEMTKRMESAQKSGDTGAAGNAMGDILGAVTGTSNVAAIPAADLKAMLPESIGDLKRTAIEAEGGETMAIAGSSAKASYAAADRSAELAIADLAGLGGIAGLAATAALANVTVDKDTDGHVQKVYKEGGRTVHEDYRKDGSSAQLAVILANGVIVSAEGTKVDMATLKSMVQSIDLAKLEATQRVSKR